jgi:enterochelin esterase family protein
MIDKKRISPLLVVFVEPRTDVTKPGTNKRTTDYIMSDPFVDFLTRELEPAIAVKYRVSSSARKRGIMGTSLGGLQATYTAFRRPHVFSLCAAQSPSYWWKREAIIHALGRGSVRSLRFYLDTGTVHDSLDNARAMRDVLEKKGYKFAYAEYLEGHNWGNWRARIPNILDYFWGFR